MYKSDLVRNPQKDKKITAVFITLVAFGTFFTLISGGTYLFTGSTSEANIPAGITSLTTSVPSPASTPDIQTFLPEFPIYPNTTRTESYQKGPITGFEWFSYDHENIVSNWYKDQLENSDHWTIQKLPADNVGEQFYLVSNSHYDVYLYIEHEEPHYVGELTDKTIIKVKVKTRE